ncbi:MAG: thioredoxin fold domain-containing protein [Candidatus Eisenbacteria bacterium]|nr:thioredoxin fold domain-containing protein [Candidatus Eisenbacteria bacterium]
MAAGSLLIACPSCQAKNRIPTTRVGQKGRCGRCQADLPGDAFYADGPVAVDDARFDLLTRRSRLPVLVDFWAGWCQPCRQLEPVVEQLARELSGRLLVVKVDTEQAVSTANRFGIRGIPTLVVLRSGLEVDRIPGALPLEALRGRLERFL